MPSKPKQKVEFGDFQTPTGLADDVCALLRRRGVAPASVLEPTCGTGAFLAAALAHFPTVERAVGFDINPEHVATAQRAVQHAVVSVDVRYGDFFSTEWTGLLADLADPLLILGNPPWVTSADLGVLGSSNLPRKANFQAFSGLDALTGKSNFDISEWMLLQILRWAGSRDATIAMLCKTAVARKVLSYAWKNQLPIARAELYGIDTALHFSATVHAGLLLIECSRTRPSTKECAVFDTLTSSTARRIGWCDEHLIADVDAYDRWRHLAGVDPAIQWRSGIKHDCSSVMELQQEGPDTYRNGLGESVQLEPDYLYPMLKSSEVANGRTPTRWMLVPQRATGENTTVISVRAPKTWDYLQHHSAALDRRASAIYRNRPRFSIFGVGPYSFAPWKVAISGFYKRLAFSAIGSWLGKPIVLDDTSYFLACGSAEEAAYLASLLNSEPARQFYGAFVFWDAKRPITTELLGRLNLRAMAVELGSELEFGERYPRTAFPALPFG